MWAKLHARMMRLNISPRLGEMRAVVGPTASALGLICLCAVLLYFRYPGNFASYQNGPPGDFGVYLKAWKRVLISENPYQGGDLSPFKYAPAVLGIIQFLPSEPIDAWFFFSTLCIVLFALTLLIGARYRSWKDVLGLGLGLGLAWKGVLETFDYGQMETLIFSIAIFSAVLFSRFAFLSGLLLGFLPWVKLPWILLGLPFVIAATRMNPSDASGSKKPPGRRLKLFVSGYVLSSFFWGAAVPSLIFGPERALVLSQEWISVLKQQPHELFFSDINQSLWITSARFFGEGTPLGIALPSLIAAICLGFLIRRRPKNVSSQDTLGWLTPWLIFVQLVNPLSWRWGSVYLVGAFFSSRRSQFAKKPLLSVVAIRPILWSLVALLWLAQLNPVVRELGVQHWTQLHGQGVITAYWLVILLLCL